MKHWAKPIVILLFANSPLILIGCSRPSVVERPPELIGSWQSDSSLARFESNRCYLFEDGQLQIFAAAYSPGQVVLTSWGKVMAWQVELKPGELRLRSVDGKLERSFRRLERAPPELMPRPWPLAPAGELPLEKVQAIQEELAKRKKVDQGIRQDHGPGTAWTKVDADNTAYLLGLVQEVGWIDAGRFGPDATVSAFLIAQHSNHLALMLAACPEIERDAKAGRISPSRFARIHDRLQILLAQRQRYGTMVGENNAGEKIVLPLEDRARVDEFRREVGLPPLGTEVKFAE